MGKSPIRHPATADRLSAPYQVWAFSQVKVCERAADRPRSSLKKASAQPLGPWVRSKPWAVHKVERATRVLSLFERHVWVDQRRQAPAVAANHGAALYQLPVYTGADA